MPRYKLTIAYDGTDFHGWQKQDVPADPAPSPSDRPPDQSKPAPVNALRTVQGEVERAVREVVREPVNLLGASRTDAGVHALAQVGAFTSHPEPDRGVGWPESRGTETLVRALNGRLPHDVLITDAAIVADDFDPISHCTSKGYAYTIVSSPTRPLWDRRFLYHTWHELDPSAMASAAAHLVGEHDFEAFAAASHGRQTTVRTIFDCSVTAPNGHIRIDVSGSGFLYNMVRIIAGTLVEVGRGQIAPDDIPRILEGRDRRAAGPTLPPEGLRLEWIRYD